MITNKKKRKLLSISVELIEIDSYYNDKREEKKKMFCLFDLVKQILFETIRQ